MHAHVPGGSVGQSVNKRVCMKLKSQCLSGLYHPVAHKSTSHGIACTKPRDSWLHNRPTCSGVTSTRCSSSTNLGTTPELMTSSMGGFRSIESSLREGVKFFEVHVSRYRSSEDSGRFSYYL